jgi:iron complex transport system permease protein
VAVAATTGAPAPGSPGAPVASARSTSFRALGLLAALGVLGLVVVLSISVGSRQIPLDRVWDLVLHPDGSDDAVIVRDLRIPRTLLGLLVGASLGLAGALMQALTRNPLADPGILGVNAGAAAMVVTGIAIFGYVCRSGSRSSVPAWRPCWSTGWRPAAVRGPRRCASRWPGSP